MERRSGAARTILFEQMGGGGGGGRGGVPPTPCVFLVMIDRSCVLFLHYFICRLWRHLSVGRCAREGERVKRVRSEGAIRKSIAHSDQYARGLP